MPLYAYTCTACGHSFDIQQSFTDDSLTVCPECAGLLRKVFSPVGVVFKGSGFYRTDNKASKKSSSSTSSGAKESTGSGSGGSASTDKSTTSASAGSTDSASSSSGSSGTGSGSSTPTPAAASAG